MSNMSERPKLTAKRENKPNDSTRQKQGDLKQNSKGKRTSKKDGIMTSKGLKRRLSIEEELPLKKACPQAKNEVLKIERNVEKNVSKETYNETRPKGSEGNLAQNRLSRLRKDIKDTIQSTSKPDNKDIAKKTNCYLQHNSKNVPNTSRSKNKDLIKKISNATSKDPVHTAKIDLRPSVTSSNFKIPIKKSANDRFKAVKECGLQGPKTKKKPNVISRSPQNPSSSLNRSYNDAKLCTSPLKNLHSTEDRIDRRIVNESSYTQTSKHENSYRFSNEYIVISEASGSEESQTPKSQRLTSIRNRSSSSSSDKTLTPSSPNKLRETTHLKIPVRSSNAVSGLKIPLNRGLFKNQTTEIAVQTEGNIFRSHVTPQKHLPVSEEHRKNNFGTETLQTYNASPRKPNKIFTSSVSSHNNNNIVSHTNTDGYSGSSIFGAATSQNIFSNFSSKIPTEDPVISSFESDSDLTHRPLYSSEPVKNEIDTSHNQLFPTQSGRKSATDRLNRIKNDGCNTYRKAQVSAFNDGGSEDQSFSKPGAMVEFQRSEGTLQHPSMYVKAILTENWLTNHQGIDLDTPMSDSMVVNVDDSILNKSELPDPIEDVSMEWDSVPQPTDVTPSTRLTPTDPEKENIICVVTDSNVFLHFLQTVKHLIDLEVKGPQKLKIYVPWMVIQELDHLKNPGQPTKSIALEAIRFINRFIDQPDSKIIGQSVLEANVQQDVGLCADNKILSCCLQVAEKYETVILLTNDTNLRSKAIMSKVEASSPQQIISKIKCMKFCQIRKELVSLWSKIIHDCCMEAYGDAWTKMDSTENLSLLECIKRFQKYWRSVFSERLLKQCLNSIDGIFSFLMSHKGDIEDNTSEFNNFRRLAMDFLGFLQDLPRHKDQIKEVVKKISMILGIK